LFLLLKGVIAALIFVIVIVCVSLRMRIWLYNNRVFSILYPEESGRNDRFDDENLPFDVFLTYAESDRHIMEQMYMDLTCGSKGRTFKCAVHDKDFVPGQSIGKCYEISTLLLLMCRRLWKFISWLVNSIDL